MTAPTFGTPAPVIERGAGGRPLIVPPGETEPVLYERASSLAKALDDGFGLTYWKVCMTLLGAAKKPAAVKAAKTMTYDADKGEVYKLAESCMEAAGAGDKATEGTTMHTLTERIDTGVDLPEGLDEQTLGDLDAYRRITAGLKTVAAEQFTVCDELRVAGTFDRVVDVLDGYGLPGWLVGRRPVLDVKNGNYRAANASIAQKLAVYSRSSYYDPATGARTPVGADQEVGLVLGLPLGQGRAELLAVDLRVGWRGAILSRGVIDWRADAKLLCGRCKGTGFFKNGNPCFTCKGAVRTPVAVDVAAA